MPAEVDAQPTLEGTEQIILAGWAGPLPPPSYVEGYGRAVENGNERIFRQFELEAEHRREMERERFALQREGVAFVRSSHSLSQWLAGLYAFGALSLAAFALYLGYSTAAGVIATGSIASVVVAFLTSGGRPNLPVLVGNGHASRDTTPSRTPAAPTATPPETPGGGR